MQVVILAGGLGTRLGEITKSRPKSMLKICGQTFLEHQLEFISQGGITDIVLCIGHMGEQIERHFGNGRSYGVNIRYSFEDKLLGTAGALKQAEALLGETFFTIYGDSYLFLNFSLLMAQLESRKKMALMTVFKNYNLFDSSNTAIEGNLVKRYGKRQKTEDMIYIDYGANAFRKEVLNMIPENQLYSLEELFPQLIDKEELLAFEVNERFYEIGSPQGLRDFERYVAEKTT